MEINILYLPVLNTPGKCCAHMIKVFGIFVIFCNIDMAEGKKAFHTYILDRSIICIYIFFITFNYI
jgi:hypothetical protein